MTRAIPEDEDVTRVSFENGKAVLEGVSLGSTTVAIEQKGTRRLITVQVLEAGSFTETPLNLTPLPSSITPVVPAATASTPVATDITPVAPAANAAPQTVASLKPVAFNSNLSVSLRVQPVEENPMQALFTVSFENRGSGAAPDVKVRYALDDQVSYVTNSATNNARYDAAARELVWNVGNLPSSARGQASFRVAPVGQQATTFYSVATIEDASGLAISSNTIKYFTATSPLLAVFALPDRILASRNLPPLVDVKDPGLQRAVDELQRIGVLSGKTATEFRPNAKTQRVEYTVMTLSGLNLRDLRALSAIKFVVGRRSTVNLSVLNSRGQVVAPLVQDVILDPGERTVLWDGRSGTGYAPAGRYTYVCSAKDTRGETTTLRGFITIVPQTPLEPVGLPSFKDVKSSDWFAGYLAIAEKQNLVQGYNGMFYPYKSINREEATTIVVRALGMEDLARSLQNQDVGFLDYQNISPWARGYMNAASTVIKTSQGKTLMQGDPANFILPKKALARGEAALMIARLIDRETTRQLPVSGQLAPGSTVTINSRSVQASDDGRFEFVLEQNTAQPTTVAVVR